MSKPLTFDEYQAWALTTAIYPREYAMVYPALGLAGEAGEVCEKIKKAIRDHGGEIDRSVLAAELSDVLWYLAALASDCEVTLSESMTTNYMVAFFNHTIRWHPVERMDGAAELANSARCLAASASNFHNMLGRLELLGDHRRDNLAMAVMEDICVLAGSIGYTLAEIAQLNLGKLADRAARGVIGGEGDAR